jgi:hypothetical protein
MERIGKSILTFLIALMLGVCPVWANTRAALADSVLQQESRPALSKGYHQVVAGDTYYSLSRRYQVPVDSLQRWNGESLQLGTTIRVSFITAQKPAITKPHSATDSVPAVNPGRAGTNNVTAKAGTGTRATKPAKAPTEASNTRSQYSGPAVFAPDNKQAQRVLVIPFDPYLYFSDADNDIALQSNIPAQNVRYIFRSRLNAFIDPKGFESINMLAGVFQDNNDELDRVYKSVSYQYQPLTYSKYNPVPAAEKSGKGPMAWIQKQKEKFTASPSPEAAGNNSAPKDAGKYYGTIVKDPDLFRYFNQQYAVDYYLFINQFEIHTDFTNCLDRTQNDFVREFQVHYTLFDNQGRLISGNKVKVPYISHVNDIEKIIRDNLNKMAQRILADLPQPETLASQVDTVE